MPAGAFGTDWERIEYRPGRGAWTRAPDAEDDTPVFILFHGGGWYGGSPDDNLYWGDYLHRLGRCYLVEYATYAHGQATVDDAVADALAFAEFYGRRHPGRPCVVWGFSAGGLLALWFARIVQSVCRSVILLSAVTDTGPEGYRNVMLPQRGRRDLSPVEFADRIRCPLLALHSSGDTTVPIAQARHFYKTLIARKTPSRLVEVDTVRHDFHRVGPHRARVHTEIRDFFIARRLVRDSYPDHGAAADAIARSAFGEAGARPAASGLPRLEERPEDAAHDRLSGSRAELAHDALAEGGGEAVGA